MKRGAKPGTQRKCYACGHRHIIVLPNKPCVHTLRIGDQCTCDETTFQPDNPAARPRRAVVNESHKRMLDAYVYQDRTLRDIAVEHGVTHQAVQNAIVRLDPTLYRLAKTRRLARIRSQASEVGIPNYGGCDICGGAIGKSLRQRKRYCSEEHYEMSITLRFVINEDNHAKHQLQTAATILRSGDGSQAYAERLLAGLPPKPLARHRWLQVGGAVHEAATLAYENDWPIVERFHPQIIEQLRSEHPPE